MGMAQMDEHLDSTLQRHKAFWRSESAGSALVGLSRYGYFPLEDFDLGVNAGVLLPEMLDPESLIPQYERLFSDGELYMGDLLWAASPIWGLPWLEAITGCPVEIPSEEPSIWARPIWDNLIEAPDIKLSWDNPWFQKLLEFMAVLAGHSQNRYPLAMPIMRGPADVLAALVGMEKLALAAYDDPARVQKLAEQCAEVFVTVARAQLELMPPFYGGYSQHQHVWAPGPTVMTQQDAALFFTPAKYRQLILPADRVILGSFDYSMMHLHSTVLHMLDDLLALDELACIQIVIDPAGPSIESLLPVFRRAQASKPLVIFGDLSGSELDSILSALSPRGLCVYNKHQKAVE